MGARLAWGLPGRADLSRGATACRCLIGDSWRGNGAAAACTRDAKLGRAAVVAGASERGDAAGRGGACFASAPRAIIIII